MTALKNEAIQLVKQLPEDQIPNIIQYIQILNSTSVHEKKDFNDTADLPPKMKALIELEEMLVPVSQELDYDKELAEARDSKYGYFG